MILFELKSRVLRFDDLEHSIHYLVTYLLEREGQYSKMVSPAAPGLIPGVPEIISVETIVDVAEVKQWCWLKASGQWLVNVDQTHLELASDKLVLQKKRARWT